MNYKELARRFAKQYGVDPDIFLRQIGAESGWNPNAKSPAGALGIAQFMPATAKGMGVNPLDPVSSLRGAAKYMAANLKQFGGDYRLALAAYNAGGGNARRALKSFPETINYVAKILGGESPASAPAPSAPIAGVDTGRIRAIRRVIKSPILARALEQKYSAQPSEGDQPQIGNEVPSGSIGGFGDIERMFGLKRSSGDNDARGVHASGSYHYRKRDGGGVQAYDYGDAINKRATLLRLAQYARSNPSMFNEFFYDPAGFYIKDGRIVKGAFGGHGDHAHAALR